MARTKITDNVNPVPTKLKEGHLVLIKDHTAKAFQPHYVGNYRIVSFKGNQVEVCKNEGGNTTWVPLNRCKVYSPSRQCNYQITRDYQSFGRKTKLRLNPDRIPNLHWNLSTTLKYNSNFDDTAITHTDKHSPLFEYIKKNKKNKLIIFLTIRFIKTY